LGKKAYEEWKPEISADVRVRVSSKARWVGLNDLQFKWSRGDNTYEAVRGLLQTTTPVQGVLRDLGLTYKVFRTIAEDILGVAGYFKWSQERKSSVGRINLSVAHKNYARLAPSAKAARLKRLYGGTCKLEADFAEALSKHGLHPILNVWQAVPIQGTLVPREADLKIDLGLHKIVVLCDGEAFHGPRFAFGDAARRVQDDTLTAEAYYALGYSVIRYSETELKSGWALDHLLGVVSDVRAEKRRLLRLWHPLTERWA